MHFASRERFNEARFFREERMLSRRTRINGENASYSEPGKESCFCNRCRVLYSCHKGIFLPFRLLYKA